MDIDCEEVDQLFEYGEFEKAISALTQLIQETNHSYWFNKRSEAYLRIGQPDKALQDATIASSMEPSAIAFLRKGNALLRLEKVEQAAEVFREGLLHVDPMDKSTKNQLHRGAICCGLLRNAERSLEGKTDNDFECVLCFKLFYEPATLPCGHTFCRHCLHQATLFNNKCPLCRTIFHSNFVPPVTISLQNIITKLFPQEYKARQLEVQEEESDEHKTLPLFIMNGICFPGEEIPLHIFEPRYRIMLKRVMQGSRTFGLINVKEDESNPEGFSLYSVGCCLEITQIETLPDGRSLVQTRATKRFQIIERTMTDGYWVAKVDYLEDQMASSEQELGVVRQLIAKVRTQVAAIIQSRQGREEDLFQLEQIVQRMDFPTNTPEECNQFSYWVCALLPISANLKQPLIEMNSATQRLQRVLALLERVTRSSNCILL